MFPKVSIIHTHPKAQPSTWIIQLSKQLRKNGIDASLDIWDLKPGQDIYAYTEAAIADETVDFVLLMVDAAYLERARDSTEEQLLRGLLYKNVHQEHIVPILNLPIETLDVLPPYLTSRLCIDWTEEQAEERLLRTILQQPSHPKPPLGQLPTLSKGARTLFSASSYLQRLAQSGSIDTESLSFFDAFVKAYQTVLPSEYDVLSTAWRLWLEQVVRPRQSTVSVDTGLVMETLERLKALTEAHPTPALNVLLHQLFLTAIIIGFGKRNFKFLDKLLQGHYFIAGNYHPFTTFNSCTQEPLHPTTSPVLDETAVYIQEQLTKTYTEKECVEADLMCYYNTLLKEKTSLWIPLLAKYTQPTTYPISWLSKLEIKAFFEKTKMLYGVSDERAFRKKMLDAFLAEQKPSPLPYPVALLQEAGLPRRINVLD